MLYPAGAAVTWSGGTWQFALGAEWGFAQRHIKFTDAFYAWSSNHYTVDHIFDEVWDNYPGGPHLTPPPYTVSLKAKPGQLYQYIYLVAGAFDTDYWIDMPAAPGGYWTVNI